MVPIRAALLIAVTFGATCLRAGPVEVEDDGVKKYSADFQAKQAATKTFECGLKQTLRLQGVKKPIISDGHIYYQAPDQLLVRFDKPSSQFVLLKGNHMVMKKGDDDPEERDLDPKSEADSLGIALLLEFFRNGASKLWKSHNVVMYEVDPLLSVTITPKNPDQRPSLIVMQLGLTNLEVRSQTVRFTPENELKYEFIQSRRDQPIKEGTFDWPRKDPAK